MEKIFLVFIIVESIFLAYSYSMSKLNVISQRRSNEQAANDWPSSRQINNVIRKSSINPVKRNYLNKAKIPILSSEMRLHVMDYKPRGFSLTSKRLSEHKVLIEFNYTSLDVYNKYIIRMRYHGDEKEYATNKTLIDRDEPNQILLKNFPKAQYVLCVTLFPSMLVMASGAFYQPISTSDMCIALLTLIDVIFGESPQFHGLPGHHNDSGLLAPLLLLIVAVQLISIPIISKYKNALKCLRDDESDEKNSPNKKDEQEGLKKSKIVSLKKVDTKQQFENLLNAKSNNNKLEFLNRTEKRKLSLMIHYDDPYYTDEIDRQEESKSEQAANDLVKFIKNLQEMEKRNSGNDRRTSDTIYEETIMNNENKLNENLFQNSTIESDQRPHKFY